MTSLKNIPKFKKKTSQPRPASIMSTSGRRSLSLLWIANMADLYMFCVFPYLTSASNARIHEPLISENVNDDDGDDGGDNEFEEEASGNKFDEDDEG